MKCFWLGTHCYAMACHGARRCIQQAVAEFKWSEWCDFCFQNIQRERDELHTGRAGSCHQEANTKFYHIVQTRFEAADWYALLWSSNIFYLYSILWFMCVQTRRHDHTLSLSLMHILILNDFRIFFSSNIRLPWILQHCKVHVAGLVSHDIACRCSRLVAAGVWRLERSSRLGLEGWLRHRRTRQCDVRLPRAGLQRQGGGCGTALKTSEFGAEIFAIFFSVHLSSVA